MTRHADGDDDNAVDATIRRLVLLYGCKLNVEPGAKMVIEKHRSRRRNEIRERIKSIRKVDKPGPTGPRPSSFAKRHAALMATDRVEQTSSGTIAQFVSFRLGVN